ncbi:hypothetical protein, partial [Bartonella refiksaydamii]|uniref:hypothetical protein n=1 Tax=Bartonella refiksaydamii TaxID=2654951 RepID=UPI001AED64B3
LYREMLENPIPQLLSTHPSLKKTYGKSISCLNKKEYYSWKRRKYFYGKVFAKIFNIPLA